VAGRELLDEDEGGGNLVDVELTRNSELGREMSK
jgi:hypothetical protein